MRGVPALAKGERTDHSHQHKANGEVLQDNATQDITYQTLGLAPEDQWLSIESANSSGG